MYDNEDESDGNEELEDEHYNEESEYENGKDENEDVEDEYYGNKKYTSKS